jgi:hypothetical protein
MRGYPMKRLTGVLLIVLTLVVVGGAGYLGTRSVQGKTRPALDPRATVEVTRGSVQQTVTAPGQIVSVRQATLALDVGGRLAEVNVQPGHAVQAGDVLAQLNLAPIEGRLVSTGAELEAAQARPGHGGDGAFAPVLMLLNGKRLWLNGDPAVIPPSPGYAMMGIVDVDPSHVINPNQEVQGWKPFLQSDCWKSC